MERIEKSGGRVLAAVCDVTDEGQAHGLVRKAEEEFGSVDILVNNAGVMLLSKVGKGLSDEWRQMFDVNVMGLLYATDAAVETMKRQQGGHLVNISSVAGRKVTRDSSGVYAGTKHTPSAPSPRACARSSWRTTSASRSSSPGPWRPSSPTTSPTRTPGRA